MNPYRIFGALVLSAFIAAYSLSAILAVSGAGIVIAGVSMYPALKTGDMAIIDSSKDFKANDIVVYDSDKREKIALPFLSAESSLVIHRIREINSTHIITKGDYNPNDDPPIELNLVKGKVGYTAPGLGCFYLFNIGKSQSSCIMYPRVMKLADGEWYPDIVPMMAILAFQLMFTLVFYIYRRIEESKILFRISLIWFFAGFIFSLSGGLAYVNSAMLPIFSLLSVSMYVPLYWLLGSIFILAKPFVRREKLFYGLVFLGVVALFLG